MANNRKRYKYDVPWKAYLVGAVILLGSIGLVWLLIVSWKEIHTLSADTAATWAYIATLLGIIGVCVAFAGGLYFGSIESRGAMWGLDRAATSAVDTLRAIAQVSREERMANRREIAKVEALPEPVMPVIHRLDGGDGVEYL